MFDSLWGCDVVRSILLSAVTRSHCGHSRVSSVFCALLFSNVVRLRGLCLSLDMHRGLHGCASHLGRYVACLPRQIQSVFRSYGCLMLLGVQCMKERTCTYIRNNTCDMVLLDAQICASHTSSNILARKMKVRLACFRTHTCGHSRVSCCLLIVNSDWRVSVHVRGPTAPKST